MTDRVQKIMDMNSKIDNYIIDNSDMTDEEFTQMIDDSKVVEKTLKILSKMNTEEILETIKRCETLTSLIDMKCYIKKYPLKKKKLKRRHKRT